MRCISAMLNSSSCFILLRVSISLDFCCTPVVLSLPGSPSLIPQALTIPDSVTHNSWFTPSRLQSHTLTPMTTSPILSLASVPPFSQSLISILPSLLTTTILSGLLCTNSLLAENCDTSWNLMICSTACTDLDFHLYFLDQQQAMGPYSVPTSTPRPTQHKLFAKPTSFVYSNTMFKREYLNIDSYSVAMTSQLLSPVGPEYLAIAVMLLDKWLTYYSSPVEVQQYSVDPLITQIMLSSTYIFSAFSNYRLNLYSLLSTSKQLRLYLVRRRIWSLWMVARLSTYLRMGMAVVSLLRQMHSCCDRPWYTSAGDGRNAGVND